MQTERIDSSFVPSKSLENLEYYQKNFPTWEKEENWEPIVEWGKKALNQTFYEEKMDIFLQVLTSLFYLGRYQEILELEKSYPPNFIKKTNLQEVRLFYLRSAVFRVLGQKEGLSSEESKNWFDLAKKHCEEALASYQLYSIQNPKLLGKIFFNFGAALADDPYFPDLKKAEEYYKEALTCFTQENCPDDIARTKIRMGKIAFLNKNYSVFDKILNEIDINLISKKTLMHLYLLKANKEYAVGNREKTLRIAEAGLLIARELKASKEEQKFLVWKIW